MSGGRAPRKIVCELKELAKEWKGHCSIGGPKNKGVWSFYQFQEDLCHWSPEIERRCAE